MTAALAGRPVAEAPPPPAAGGRRFGSLVVFSDDWGRHPSSCQHLTRHLLADYGVLWVNTIGLRPPRADRETLRRAAGKLRQWTAANRADTPAPAAGPAPAVLNPRMWPWFRRPHDRAWNRRLLSSQLRPAIERLRDGRGPTAAVCTVPVLAPLVGALPVDRWVYYCVDDFSVWPGVDGRTAGESERTLVRSADRLVAAGPALADRLRAMDRRADVAVVGHGFEPGFWENPTVPFPHPLPAGRLVVFWGLVDRRLDAAAVRAIAESVGPDSPAPATVLLVGPGQDEDPALATPANVLRLPAVSREALPALAAAADVLVMPYADAPVTRAMQPLKLLEYLAAGKPAVVRDLPATRPHADCCDLADGPEAFARLVSHRLLNGESPERFDSRARRLEGVSWASRARQFEAAALS